MNIYETAEKPVPQIQSSQAALGFFSVILGAFLMIVLTVFCYRFLPEAVAKDLSEQIWDMIKTAAIGGGIIGAAGVSIRGLMLTKDRIEKTKASAINDPYLDIDKPSSDDESEVTDSGENPNILSVDEGEGEDYAIR